MKIQLASDLHLEFFIVNHPMIDDSIKPVLDRDLLILAGDIGCKGRQWGFIKRQLEISDVAYIPGNHEFYHGDVMETTAMMTHIAEEISKDSKHKLFAGDCFSFQKDEVSFFCATMWTDFNNRNERTMDRAGWGMNDYHLIGKGGKTFTPADALEIHDNHRAELDLFLHNTVGKRVVVTHTAPHKRSIGKRFRDTFEPGSLNWCYFSDLSETLHSKNAPAVWCHGHTHSHADYVEGNTRVIANPKGYVGEEWIADYIPDLCFEV